MRTRNFVSAFFIVAYGVGMAVLGYLGRHNYVETEIMMAVTLLAAGLAAGLFWGVWNLDVSRRSAEDSAKLQNVEKRKREDIDSVLRDMSSADLVLLRRRLNDGDFDEGQIVDEEGELLLGGKKR